MQCKERRIQFLVHERLTLEADYQEIRGNTTEAKRRIRTAGRY